MTAAVGTVQIAEHPALTLDQIVDILAARPFDEALAQSLAKRYVGVDADGEYLAAVVDLFAARIAARDTLAAAA